MKDLVYSKPARVFHWTVVLLLVLQYLLGWFMPDVKKATPAVGLIALHLTVGFVVLIVVLFRFGWRLSNTAPALPGTLPVWQNALARSVHAALYLLLFALPLTGWLNASTRSWKPILLTVIPMPRLVPSDNALGHGVGEYHSLLSWVLLILIGVHVLGALYHQFILKDNLIERMWNRKR